MTSYEIKATPFYKRIMKTNKKPNELQQLKAEYEHLRTHPFFNETLIELRMRQARLKRLFQEIEEIKANEVRKREIASLKRTPRIKTERDVKSEQLQNAKDLGQYYSQCNGCRPTNGCRVGAFYRRNSPNNCHRVNMKVVKAKQEQENNELKRGRIFWRQSYGNEMSNYNMQLMVIKNIKKQAKENLQEEEPSSDLLSDSTATSNKRRSRKQFKRNTEAAMDIDRRRSVRQGLAYGNRISDLNKRTMPCKRSSIKYIFEQSDTDSSTIEASASVVTIKPCHNERQFNSNEKSVTKPVVYHSYDLLSQDYNTIKSCHNDRPFEIKESPMVKSVVYENYDPLSHGSTILISNCTSEEGEKHRIARERWHRLAILLNAVQTQKDVQTTNPRIYQRPAKQSPPFHYTRVETAATDKSYIQPTKYQLKSISNGTAILQEPLRSNNNRAAPDLSYYNCKEKLAHKEEIFLNSEKLNLSEISLQSQVSTHQPLIPIPPPLPQKNNSIAADHHIPNHPFQLKLKPIPKIYPLNPVPMDPKFTIEDSNNKKEPVSFNGARKDVVQKMRQVFENC